MFGSKKDKPKKEKPQYSAYVGWGSNSSLYYVFEYQILDNGIVQLRTDGQGIVNLMPGTPCMIKGGEWSTE